LFDDDLGLACYALDSKSDETISEIIRSADAEFIKKIYLYPKPE